MTPDTSADAEPNRQNVMAMSLGSKEWEDRLAAARAARAKVLADKQGFATASLTPEPPPGAVEAAEAPARAAARPISAPGPAPMPVPTPASQIARPMRRRWPQRIAMGAAFFAIGIGGGAYVAHLLTPQPKAANSSIALTPQPVVVEAGPLPPLAAPTPLTPPTESAPPDAGGDGR